MYKSEYFKPYEFVPQNIYELCGDQSIKLMDCKILKIADLIRDWFGEPMTINDYKIGLQNRGYRAQNTTVGAAKSQHKLGKAIDFNISGLSAKEVYMELITHEEAFYDMGIRRIEKIEYTPTWTHIDIKDTGLSVIQYIKP